MKKYFVIESEYREVNDEEKTFIRENNLTHKQYFPKGEDIENKTVETEEVIVSPITEVEEEVKTKGRKKNS